MVILALMRDILEQEKGLYRITMQRIYLSLAFEFSVLVFVLMPAILTVCHRSSDPSFGLH